MRTRITIFIFILAIAHPLLAEENPEKAPETVPETKADSTPNAPFAEGQGDLEARYFNRQLDHMSAPNHYFTNIIIGGATGGVFGYGAGLGFATEPLDDSVGQIVIAAGFGSGVLLAYWATDKERDLNQQFTYGRSMWQAGWYGALFGGLLGTGIGVPLAGTDPEDFLQYTGFGVLAGVPTAIVLFFINYKDGDSAFNRQAGEVDWNVGMYTRSNPGTKSHLESPESGYRIQANYRF